MRESVRLRADFRLWVLAVTVGVVAGIGGYTFSYAEGLSYFSTDPAACVNCHIMQPQYDGWQHSSHHAVAVCVDCHLPETFVPKYLAKAENGWRHGKLFTTGGFEEPITVKPAGQQILQDNCLRCHGPLTDAIQGHWRAPEGDQVFSCTHCHRSVGHGVMVGLGGPMTSDELNAQEQTNAGATPSAGDSHE